MKEFINISKYIITCVQQGEKIHQRLLMAPHFTIPRHTADKVVIFQETY